MLILLDTLYKSVKCYVKTSDLIINQQIVDELFKKEINYSNGYTSFLMLSELDFWCHVGNHMGKLSPAFLTL